MSMLCIACKSLAQKLKHLMERVSSDLTKKDLENLRATFSTLNKFIPYLDADDVPEWASRDWLAKVEDAAFEAINALDECAMKAEEEDRDSSATQPQATAFLSSLFNFNNKCIPRPEIAEMGKKLKQVRDMTDELKQIRDMIDEIQVRHRSSTERGTSTSELHANLNADAMMVSYKFVPFHLRPYLFISSVFPRDHPMDKDELISFWIANGLTLLYEPIEQEVVGENMLNELLDNSLFHDLRKDSIHNNITCKMHHHVHDLAAYAVYAECLTLTIHNNTDIVTREVQIQYVRHLSLVCESLPPSTLLDSLFQTLPLLRSLLFFSGSTSLPDPDPSTFDVNLSNLTCLRTLDVSGMGIQTLPPSILHLKKLRYLNLSNNHLTSLPDSIQTLTHLQFLFLSKNGKFMRLPHSIGQLHSLRYLNLAACGRITSLPESIGSLRKLQSLMLQRCVRLRQLPQTMNNISSLKHLDIVGCDMLTGMPVGIGQLTSLRTLNYFVVGRPDSDNGCGLVSELKGLNQLRGELRIEGLENVRNLDDAKKANLRNKQYLTELTLIWRSCLRDDYFQVVDTKEILKGFQLPPNISKLEISGYPGADPETYLQNQNTVQHLKFIGCNQLVSLPIGLQMLTSLVQLEIYFCNNLKYLFEVLPYPTSLQKLLIVGCPKLKLEIEDFQYFNSLQSLTIQGLPKLRALPPGIRYLTTLKHLGIQGCENLRNLPEWLRHLSALQSLSLSNCHPDLHIRCENEGEYWPFISHITNLYLS